MKKLDKYFKGYVVQAFLGPVLKFFETSMELLMPIAISVMINNIYGEPTYLAGQLLTFSNKSCIIFLIVVVFFNYICAAFAQRFAAVSSMGFGANLRSAMYKHINSMTFSELDRLGTATCINRITNDVNSLQNCVAKFFRLIFRLPVLIIGSLVLTFLINVKIGLIFLCTLPIIVFFLFLIMRLTISGYGKAQEKLDVITGLTRENLTGTRVIRAFSRQNDEYNRQKEENSILSRLLKKVNNISALLSPISSLIINLSIVLILLFSGKQVNGGNLTSGDVSAFITYSLWVFNAMVIFANLSIEFTRAEAAKKRINQLFEIGGTEIDGTLVPTPQKEILKFDKVNFAYFGDKDVLHNIDFSVNEGELIGIIGGTGSGKSTLLNLIPRFYKVEKGGVYFDGVNVNELQGEALRKNIAIVPQKPVLFTGTIEENIAWGLTDYDKNKVIECAKIAQADEFISKLEDGYNSHVDAGGRNFSGGQIQRLTIARALMREPRLLILDDSSSSLDFVTDAKLRIAIHQLCVEKHLTVIIVSQRAGTIRQTDKIIVMDNGRITDIGTHTELSQKDGLYKDICLSQFKEEV